MTVDEINNKRYKEFKVTTQESEMYGLFDIGWELIKIEFVTLSLNNTERYSWPCKEYPYFICLWGKK